MPDNSEITRLAEYCAGQQPIRQQTLTGSEQAASATAEFGEETVQQHEERLRRLEDFMNGSSLRKAS